MFDKKDSKTQAMAMKLAQLDMERLEPEAKYKISEALGEVLGMKVPVPEKFHKALKVQNKITRRHEMAMNYHAEQYKQANEHFWTLVKASLPDLDWDRYAYNIHRDKFLVTCCGVNKK